MRHTHTHRGRGRGRGATALSPTVVLRELTLCYKALNVYSHSQVINQWICPWLQIHFVSCWILEKAKLKLKFGLKKTKTRKQPDVLNEAAAAPIAQKVNCNQRWWWGSLSTAKCHSYLILAKCLFWSTENKWLVKTTCASSLKPIFHPADFMHTFWCAPETTWWASYSWKVA